VVEGRHVRKRDDWAGKEKNITEDGGKKHFLLPRFCTHPLSLFDRHFSSKNEAKKVRKRRKNSRTKIRKAPERKGKKPSSEKKKQLESAAKDVSFLLLLL
jgi:hypothetical protein